VNRFTEETTSYSWPSLQVGGYNLDQILCGFLGGFGIPRHVVAYVVFHQLGHKAVDGSSRRGQSLQHVHALFVFAQGTQDGFQLGVDNNLTRKVSLSDATWIASVKGLAAGSVNLMLAFSRGAALPSWPSSIPVMLVGLLAYGVSLALFVVALRHLGSARTGAYFSIAPFFGALLALSFGETITLPLVVTGALMAIGIWLHLTERHQHEHKHPRLEHEHEYIHDEHHQHEHDAPVGPRGQALSSAYARATDTLPRSFPGCSSSARSLDLSAAAYSASLDRAGLAENFILRARPSDLSAIHCTALPRGCESMPQDNCGAGMLCCCLG
jgi:hypothetical protein